ncbi:MAG: PVC-type heme-binding CxxCH protein, partial [Verrucomicrobiota bacterium]
MKSIHVPEAFTVDLVAAEPEVLDPVAFDWDSRGRLWVVEMADYPSGMDGRNRSGGRVRRLEDLDRDGRYESSTLFADGLNFPNGILTWRDGVIVTAAPDVLYLRDTNDDGKLDQRDVLLSGLTEGNQQLRANGLRWGLDHWVYVAAGGHHSKHGLNTRVRSHRTEKEIAVGSRDFRFRPDTGEVEPQSGPSQFGRNRDDWGRWFGTQNVRPLWHYVLPDHYLRRNPYLAAPEGRVQLPGPLNPPVYPTSKRQKRYHSFKQGGGFTSACSGMIYRGGSLFSPDEIHAFSCEPFHNLVQHMVLEPHGVTFQGQRAEAKDEPDFFASSDRWCRPVMTRTGPDGALWVADMYRYMIEHPHWLPQHGKEELLAFYRTGETYGRIYRVRPRSSKPQPLPNFVAMTAEELAEQLASPNGWIRDKAQMELLWRGDASVPLPLTAPNPRTRLHALCTLDGLGRLTDEAVLQALADPHPGVRENALRLAENATDTKVHNAAFERVDDPDLRVQLQLAFSVGAFPPSPRAGHVLSTLLNRHADNVFIRTAVLSSALPHQAEFSRGIAGAQEKELYDPLIELAIKSKNPDLLKALLEPALEQARSDFSPESIELCLDLLDLLARRKQSMPSIASWNELLERARTEDSAHASGLLARVPAEREKAITDLGRRLQPATPPAELKKTLEYLAGTGSDRVPEMLLKAWPGLTPTARGDVLDRLLSRTAWTAQLVDALKNRTVNPGDFDATRRNRLLNHADEKIRSTAANQFKSTGDRADVIKTYRSALSLQGQAARGRDVFFKACVACHKHGHQGNEIGPDLKTVAAHSAEKLMINILDPNLDIQPGFHAYQCTLKNGEQLFGIIASETATGITLKLVDGSSKVLLRRDIARLRNLNISLMPEGLET